MEGEVFQTQLNNTDDDGSKNVIASPNATLLEIGSLQNNLGKFTVFNINQTFLIKNNSLNENKIKSKKLDDPNGFNITNNIELQNVTASQNKTLFEFTGLQNNSEKSTVLHANQTFATKDKHIHGNENKPKYVLHGFNEFNSTDEKTQNFITTQNITLVWLIFGKNTSEKSISLNTNKTFVIKEKPINKVNEFLDPLISRTYEEELIPFLLVNNSKNSNNTNKIQVIFDNGIETTGTIGNGNKNKPKYVFDGFNEFNSTDDESKNVITIQNVTLIGLIGGKNISKESSGLNINETSVIKEESTNENENITKEFLDLLISRTHEQELIPLLVVNNSKNSNITSKIQVIVGDRIGTTAIITLQGGGGPIG